VNRVLQVVLTGNNTSLRQVLSSSSREVQQFGNEVRRSNNGMVQSGNLAQTSLKALAGAGVLVAAGLGYAVVKAAEFEKNMRNVNSLSGLSEGALQSLEGQILQMSKTLPQSAATLSDGLYDIASSGFQGAAGVTVLKSAAIAASAGLTTTAVSARAITAVLNAYGLTAASAGDVSDTLFQAVNLGVVSFDELAGSIGDVVGTAAAAKINIAGVSAAIATMTLTGISGAESATSLNQLIQSMIKPSDALAQELKTLGYESGQQALEADGLRGVMEKLRKATGGNVTQLLQLFPNIRAARGALALMSAEGRNYAKVSAEIEDKNRRQGATQKVLNEQMKSASAQFQVFKNQADAAAIQLGLRTIPALTATMHGFTELAGWIGSTASKVGHALTPAWRGLVQIATLVWHVLADVAKVGGTVAGALLKIGGSAIIGTLNLVLRPLGELAGFIDHNTVLTWTLIAAMTAYALSLNAVRVAAWRVIGTPLVLGFVRLYTAVRVFTGTLTAGLVPALTAARVALAKLATATVLLGIIAVIADQVNEIKKVATAGDDARDSIKGMNKAVSDSKGNSDRYEAISKNIQDLKEGLVQQHAIMEKNKADWSAYGIFIGQFQRSPADYNDAKAAAKQYQAQLEKMWQAQRRFGVNVSDLGARFKMSRADVIAFADANKIDLSGSIDKVQFQFGRLKDIDLYSGSTRRGTEDLIKAMGTMVDSTADEEDKLKALKDALDALGGKTVDVFTAQSQLQEIVDGAAAAIKDQAGAVLDAHGQLNAYSEAGRAAGGTLTDIADKGNTLIESMVKQGSTLDEVKAKDAELRASFIKSAGAMGIGTEAANRLADQILGIPADRETQFKALISGAQADIDRLQKKIDDLKGKTVEIAAHVVATFDQNGNIVKKAFGGGTGKIVMQRYGGVWLPGAGGAKVAAFAEGGLTGAITPAPKGAMIAPDGANMWHWAEKGTGGEAFVPLGDRHSTRSKEMVAWLYSYFFPAAVRAFASGGFGSSPSGYASAVPPSSPAPAGTRVIIHSPITFAGPVYGEASMRRVAEQVVDKRDAALARNARSAR